MKKNFQRILAVVAVSSVFLPWQGVVAAKGGSYCLPLPNARLDAHHPSALCGRDANLQEGYVDLYAPLTPNEAKLVAGYRDSEGRVLPAPDAQR